jgi:hypothetical protein
LVFNPEACADHIAAPQPGGRRFGPKYCYYHARNNLVMVIRNYGIGAMAFKHILAVGVASTAESLRKIASGVVRLVCSLAGLAVGTCAGAWYLVTTGRNPERPGAKAEKIRASLRGTVPSPDAGGAPVESAAAVASLSAGRAGK